MKIKIKNVVQALREQLPLKRLFRNFFITRNAWGMFHENSHIRQGTGQPKVIYFTRPTAEKAAAHMQEKYGNTFKPYKCVFCDGYHIGKNQK